MTTSTSRRAGRTGRAGAAKRKTTARRKAGATRKISTRGGKATRSAKGKGPTGRRKAASGSRARRAASGARAAAAPRSREDVTWILRQLARAYPDAACTLDHRSPLELLVATILSAQCTDERVNQVTPSLFRRFPDAASFASSDPDELREAIRSTGFFNNKARNIRAAAGLLVERHRGEVPENLEDLLALPGVARKTANVVLGTAFGKAMGIVVDTHVFRLSRRLGLASGENPDAVERELMEAVPRSRWIWVSHALIQHGRRVCLARNPRCPECSLAARCPSRMDLGT